MITTQQLFQAKPHSAVQERAAAAMLLRANALAIEYEQDTGRKLPVCPNTGTQVSGSKGGQGDGGFRLASATTGGEHSSHKILWRQDPDGTWHEELVDPKAAVDWYDPEDHFDAWITDERLERHDLYREHPDATKGWAHLTDRAPHSGHRTFRP